MTAPCTTSCPAGECANCVGFDRAPPAAAPGNPIFQPDHSVACFGMCCQLRRTCVHYANVEHPDATTFIEHCGLEHSAFVAAVPPVAAGGQGA